jgi:hypothetical protein
MNYGETLAYWYLRLNGFLLLQNFVLHPLAESEGNDKKAADSDLLAVRFPYVYEETGGQSDDWDPRLRTWGFAPEEEIIGLIIEVKTSPGANRSKLEKNSFNRSRMTQAVRRMGMFKSQDAESIVSDLQHEALTARRDSYRIGKLLFSQRVVRGAWLNITLQEAEKFIQKRLTKYSDPKRQARMFFPDELMQYLAWKAGESSSS